MKNSRSSKEFVDKILEAARNAPEELAPMYSFYLGDPVERTENLLNRISAEIIKPLKEENEKLKEENSRLKAENEKLKDHVHTGFGGNS